MDNIFDSFVKIQYLKCFVVLVFFFILYTLTFFVCIIFSYQEFSFLEMQCISNILVEIILYPYTLWFFFLFSNIAMYICFYILILQCSKIFISVKPLPYNILIPWCWKDFHFRWRKGSKCNRNVSTPPFPVLVPIEKVVLNVMAAKCWTPILFKKKLFNLSPIN